MCNEFTGKVPNLLVDYGSQSEILSTLKSTARIKYTCFNVSDKYIIFGATSGSLYLFNREPCSFLQIIPNQEGAVSNVTISPNEQLIAFSSYKGIVCVVEKLCKSSGTNMLIKSFEHSSSEVTDFVWTSSSNQLFVGDGLGRISVINTSLFLGKTVFQVACFTLMQLDSKIVQLSTCQDWLLVSTLTRSYLCDTVHEQYRQIGKKLRDGTFGACFVQNKIYSARPGARIWEVNFEGKVTATQQYKNSLNVPPTPLVKLNETNLNCSQNTTEPERPFNFSKLGIINDKYIFTFTNDALYIFDPEKLDLVLWNNDVTDILDVKCFQDTLYVWSSHNKVNVFTLSPLDKCLLRLYFNENYLTCAKLTLHFANHLLNSPHLLNSLHHLNDLNNKLKRYENIDNLNENLQPILNELVKYSKENRVMKLNSGIYLVNNDHNGSVQNFNKNTPRSSSVPRERKSESLDKTVSLSSTSLPDLDFEDEEDDSDDENQSKFLTITSPDIIHDALVELGNNVSDSIRNILDVRKINKSEFIMEPFDVGKPDFLLGLDNQTNGYIDKTSSGDIVKKNKRNKNRIDTSEIIAVCDKYNTECKLNSKNENRKIDLEFQMLNLILKLNTNLKQNLSAQYLQCVSIMIRKTLSNNDKIKLWLRENEMKLFDQTSLSTPINHTNKIMTDTIGQTLEKRRSMIETGSINKIKNISNGGRQRNYSFPSAELKPKCDNLVPNKLCVSSSNESIHQNYIYKEMFKFDNQNSEKTETCSSPDLPHSLSLINSEYKELLEEIYTREEIYIDILLSKLLEKLSLVLNVSSCINIIILTNFSNCYFYSLNFLLNLQEHINVSMNVGLKEVNSSLLVNLNMILIMLQLGHMVTCVDMYIKCGTNINLRLISYVIIKLYTRYIENGIMEHEAYMKCNNLFLTFLNHLYVRQIHIDFEDKHVLSHTLRCFLCVNQKEDVLTCKCGFPLSDKQFPKVYYLNIGKLLLVTYWDKHKKQFVDSETSESSSTTVTVLPKTCNQCGKLPKNELDNVQAKFKIFDDFHSRNYEHIESYEQLLNICRLVPGMWKHILCLIRNSNYFVCSLFLSIHLGLVSELPFCVEDVHDSQMLEVLILLNIKVKKGFCLNCGKQGEENGGALSWTELCVFVLKCLGAQSTLQLFSKYAQFIPSYEINRRFFQSCALSAMVESKRPESDSLPYSVICAVHKNTDSGSDFRQLLGYKNLTKLQAAMREDSANVSCNGTDVSTICTDIQTDTQISHWGVRINFPETICLFCSLPLRSVALLQGPHNGLISYPCAHVFHTMCVRHSSCCTVCPICSTSTSSSNSSTVS